MSRMTSDRRQCQARSHLAFEQLEDRNAPGDLLGGPDGGMRLGPTTDAPDSSPPAVAGRHEESGQLRSVWADGPSAGAAAALPRPRATAPTGTAWFGGGETRSDPVPGTFLPTRAGRDAERGVQLYVSSFTGNAIERVNPAGHVHEFAGSGLDGPGEIAFDARGNLFVANFGVTGTTISKVTPSGEVSTFVGGLVRPLGMAFDAHGFLFATTPVTNTVLKISPEGAVTTFASGGVLNLPAGLAFDGGGNLYVTNFGGGTVSKIAPGGAVSTFASGFTGPTGMAFDAAGTLYVASGASRIDKIAPDGMVTPFVTAGLDIPVGMAFDVGGTLYVGNEGAGTVSRITPTGAVSTFATGIAVPQDVAFRPVSEG